MEANTQEAFLTHVAKCLGRSKPLTEAPTRTEVGPPTFWKEQKHYYDKTLELFKNNLEALTGRVVVAESAHQVQTQIQEWLHELGAKSIMCWDHERLTEIANPEALGVKVHYWNDEKDRDTLKDIVSKVDVGLTWADYAIGYTGTLALLPGPKQGRSVSVLPPTHIAVFTRSQLVPTMSYVVRDLLAKKDNFPSAINFITGPSRTSDIEMDLSIGVHGPFRIWVIILDEGETI